MAEERAALIEEARRQAEELARIAAEKAEEERKAGEDLQKAQNAVNGAAALLPLCTSFPCVQPVLSLGHREGRSGLPSGPPVLS